LLAAGACVGLCLRTFFEKDVRTEQDGPARQRNKRLEWPEARLRPFLLHRSVIASLALARQASLAQ